MKRSGRRRDTRGHRSPGEAPLVASVDDDASVRQPTRRLIHSFGYRAEAFGSDEEFLSAPCVAQTARVRAADEATGEIGLQQRSPK